MDPHAIAKALPGVDQLIPIEGESEAWRANIKLSLAMVSGTFSGVIRMTDIDDAQHRYRLSVNGEGQQSVIGGTALISLAPGSTDHQTILTWNGEATIAGKLAGIGQRLIGAAAGMLSKQFFRGLARQIPAS